MRRTAPPPSPRAAPRRGFTLLESLIAILVLVFGMLATANLMVRAQQAEFESYQRRQALLLVDEITARLLANRPVADDCYAVTTDPAAGTPSLGTGNSATPVCTAGSVAQQARAVADLQAIQGALVGAGEQAGGGNVGGLLAARGCISVTGNDTVGFTFTVTVAWQGQEETVAPPAAVGCGTGQYGSEARRRVVTGTLYVPNLGT